MIGGSGRWLRVAASAASVVGALAACRREERRFSEPPSFERRSAVPVPRTQDEVARFLDNSWSVSEGQRLFGAFNCAGCHALGGGGGMGPALRDGEWRYGGSPEAIRQSIVTGRPNGMPAFGTRVPEYQIWQLVAYVVSLSGRARQDVAPSRGETISLGAPPVMTPELPPVPEASARKP